MKHLFVINPAAGRGAFYSESGDVKFTYRGGTISTGSIPLRLIVSGGSLDANVVNPVAENGTATYTNAYRVTIGSLPRHALVSITNIEGLSGYDTEGIYAN